MRAALWLLGLFALAVAFTLAARLADGYVIIVLPPWRIELSVMLTLTLLAAGLGVTYFLLRLAGIALNLSGDLRAWRARKRREQADAALIDALRAHFDGDAQRAQASAQQALESTAPDLARRLLAAPTQDSGGAADGTTPSSPA